MSVGNSTGQARLDRRRSRRSTGSSPTSASTTRSFPARSLLMPTRAYPSRSSSSETALRPILVHLEDEPAGEHLPGRRARAARSGPSSTSAPRGSHSRTSGSSVSSSPASTYGGLETTRSNGPARPASRSPCAERDGQAVRLRVLGGQAERVRRDVGRVHASVRAVPVRSRARSRRCPCRRRRRAATRRRRAARGTVRRRARSRAAGRGRADPSCSVSRRKSQSPST